MVVNFDAEQKEFEKTLYKRAVITDMSKKHIIPKKYRGKIVFAGYDEIILLVDGAKQKLKNFKRKILKFSF